MQDNTIVEKICTLLSIVIREYILGTSIYLMALFTLHINKSINAVNLIFWIVMINFVFEKFVLKNNKNIKNSYNYLNIAVRFVFIGINILGFGFNIFNF